MSAPSDAGWFISRDGQRAGPFTAEEFAEFEEAGHLRPTDQIWQPGMDAWIAYRDYDARQAAARLVKAKAVGEKCAICLLVRRWIGVLTNTAMNAFRSVSARFARKRDVSASSSASNASPAHAPEGVPGTTLRPSADAHSGSTRSSLFGAADVPRRASAPSSEQPARGGVIGGKPRHEAVSDAATEDLVRRARSTPRLATEVRAATDIGLDLATFRTWVADGRLPGALPDCGKYDMKAIHLALDRMSGIASREGGSNDWSDWFARKKG